MLDGVPLAVSYSGIEWHEGGGDPGCGIDSWATRTAPPGAHTVTGAWTTGHTGTCAFVVE